MKYVQYSITVSVNVEEPLEDVLWWDEAEQTEEAARNYIEQERWDFLADYITNKDWDINVKIVEREK